MTPRTVVVLAVLTVVTVTAAAVAVAQRPGPSAVAGIDRSAFPDLRQRPQDVARITVDQAGGTITFARTPAGPWRITERADYPADDARIRELVVGLAEMRLVEAKTARPERFQRLEVEDVGGEGAKSRRVTVSAADGAVLADVVVGKRLHAATGGRDNGTYVRRAGDDRAWLASGGVTIGPRAVDWMARDLIDLSSDRVKRLEIVPAGSEPYVLARTAATDQLALESAPAGAELRADEARRLASAFVGVELQDVLPADRLGTADARSAVRVATFDGLELRARVFAADNDRWALLDAGKGEAAEAAVDAEVEALSRRFEGWAFKLPPSVAERWTSPPAAPPTPPDGEDAAPADDTPEADGDPEAAPR
jgi:hypothetical protein